MRIFKKIYNLFLQISPKSRRQKKIFLSFQDKSINLIDRLSRTIWNLDKDIGYKNILIDGMWDNPNYWTRFGLIRAAMGYKNVNEIGILGKYSRKNVKDIFSKLGIDNLIDYKSKSKISLRCIKKAKKLIKNTDTNSDILKWKLPYEFPAELFYDAILKRQRKMHVDVKDPLFVNYVAEGLACIEASSDIFTSQQIDFVILSHIIDFSYTTIAWLAAINKVPVVVIYGDFGASRFIRINNKEDIFLYPGVPEVKEINSLSPNKKKNLIDIGSNYLFARLNGDTDDIGSVYSYQKRKQEVNRDVILQKFDWSSGNNIIGLYLSNWYDYPHSFGLREYDDFYDWTMSILNIAKKIKNVNWLVKSHPCDDWYGGTIGTNINNIIDEIGMPNIQLADKKWNGHSLIESLDGIVTPHGTIAFEAVFLGVPVLATSNCWYKNGSFVPKIKDHQDFISYIQKNVWLKPDKKSIDSCKLFAGIFWGFPSWQEGFIFKDDSNQEKIYMNLPDFLRDNEGPIESEINSIRNWLESSHSYYNIFKMINSESYNS